MFVVVKVEIKVEGKSTVRAAQGTHTPHDALRPVSSDASFGRFFIGPEECWVGFVGSDIVATALGLRCLDRFSRRALIDRASDYVEAPFLTLLLHTLCAFCICIWLQLGLCTYF